MEKRYESAEELFQKFSREELIRLLAEDGKLWVACDGLWFQGVERAAGMDEAMRQDLCMWEAFTRLEAARIKAFLRLPERPGLAGLAQALPLRINNRSNAITLRLTEETLLYRVETCRVQAARKRKGLPYHPCRAVGLVEYGGFSRAIDDRIAMRCLSCWPEVTDESCACAWEFFIEK